MVLRPIEMVLREEDGDEVQELSEERKVLEQRGVRLPDGEVLDAVQSETVMDVPAEHCTGGAAAARGLRVAVGRRANGVGDERPTVVSDEPGLREPGRLDPLLLRTG